MENKLASIKNTLQEKPWEFSFHQMLFILELLNKNKARFGCGKISEQEPINLRAYCKFYAPSSDCVEYEKQNGQEYLTINQTSLIGINGILPQPYTEKILAKIKEKNFSTLDFLNIFHQRTFGLMHKLEKKKQLNLSTSLFENFEFCHAIGGILNNSNKKNNWKDVFYPVSNFLWQKNKNAPNLIRILGSIFNFKFEVKEFLPSVIEIADDAKTSLNKQPLKNKMLGSFAKCYSKNIILNVLIDDVAEFENTLPGTHNCELIKKITKYYVLPGMKVKYKIMLVKEKQKHIQLNKSKKLGYNTWLKTLPKVKDAIEYIAY